MIKRKCIICGRVMQFYNPLEKRDICSETCRRENRRRQLASPDDGPSMPMLKAEDITDDGYLALVKAVVARASHDVIHFKAGTQIRVQAEKFFESEHFSNLTGLDGEAVLRDLRKKADKRKPDTRGRKPRIIGTPRSVLCVDTGVMYPNVKAAAEATGCHKACIQQVCTQRRKKTRGLRFKYVEEGAT